MKKIILTAFIILPLLLAAYIFITPDAGFSIEENRALATAEGISGDVLSGDFQDDLETYLSDQFPLRTQLKKAENNVKAALGAQELGGAYISGDYLYQAVTEDDIDRAALVSFAESVDRMAAGSGIPVYAMPVPSAGAALPGQLPAGAAFYDYDSLLAELTAAMPHVTVVDVKEALGSSPDNYYHGDHHWTMEGVLSAYRVWRSTWRDTHSISLSDTDPSSVTDYPSTDIGRTEIYTATSLLSSTLTPLCRILTLSGDFRGTLWSRALTDRIPADIIRTAEIQDCVSVTADGREIPFYDLSALETKDKYNVFLGGNHGIVIIENPEAAADRTLVIIRDSFASSFVPLLTYDYSRIVMLDDRYMLTSALAAAPSYEPDAILILKEITN